MPKHTSKNRRTQPKRRILLTEMPIWDDVKDCYVDERDPSEFHTGQHARVLVRCPDCGRVRLVDVPAFAEGKVRCQPCSRKHTESLRTDDLLVNHESWETLVKPYYRDERDPATVHCRGREKIRISCPTCGQERDLHLSRALKGCLTCRSCAAKANAAKRKGSKRAKPRPCLVETPFWDENKHLYCEEENQGVDIGKYSVGSQKHIWVRCAECGCKRHVAIYSWAGGATMCKSCSARQSGIENGATLLTDAPFWQEHQHLYLDEDNPSIDLEKITAKSDATIRVRCEECGRVKETKVCNWTDGKTRCYDCSRHAADAVHLIDTPFWKKNWHLYCFERNADISLRDLVTGSAQRIWTYCCECGEPKYQRVSNWYQGQTLCRTCATYQEVFDRRATLITETDFWKENGHLYCHDMNEDVDLSRLTTGAGLRIWVKCPDCGRPRLVYTYAWYTGKLKCHACGLQASLLEEKIAEALDPLSEFGLQVVPQWSHDDCQLKRRLRFDFAILDKDDNPLACVEGQGAQHYQPIDFFGGEAQFLRQCERDKVKSDFCHENGIPLLPISHLFTDERAKPRFSDDEIRHSVIGFLATCDIIPSAAYFDLYAPRPSGSVPPSCAHDSYEVVGRVSCDEGGEMISYGIGRQALKGEEFDALKASPERAVEEVLRNAGRELGEGECLFEVVLTHVRTPSATAEYDCWHDLAPLETIVIPVSPLRLPV